MVDPHRMMRKYDPAEGFTQPLVHAWFVGVNINAIRCTQHDACITLVGWCAQPLAYAWRAWVNATATRCRVDVLKDAFSGAMEAGGVEGKIGALAVEKAAKALGLDLEEIVSSHRREIHHRRLEESRRYEAATGPALGAPARALP